MNTETAPVTHFPTFRRIPAATRSFLRAFFGFLLKLPLRSWRLFRRVFLSRRSFVVYAVGGTAVCLFYAACDWHYRRAWNQEKERITAFGGSLDISKLIAPLPPEQDNFFGTPVLKEFYESPENAPTRLTMWYPEKRAYITLTRKDGTTYQKEIPRPKDDSLASQCEWLRLYGNLPSPPQAPPGSLELLADHRFDDIFQELSAAAKRPESRVPRLYVEPSTISGETFKVRPMMRLITSLILRGRAMIAAGDVDGAADMLRISRKISDGYAAYGSLIGVLISNNYSWMEGVLREGMKDHHWTERALTSLLEEDHRPLYHQAWARAAETERAFGCGVYESQNSDAFRAPERIRSFLGAICPDGLWLRACIRSSRFNEGWGKETGPLSPGESWALRAQRFDELPKPSMSFFETEDDHHYNFIISLVAPCFVKIEITRTAIRLERHWLKHHRYPATLAELDPVPPEGIPLGMDGKPLRYRTNAEGSTFRVWSPRRPAPSNPDPAAVDRDDLFFANE